LIDLLIPFHAPGALHSLTALRKPQGETSIVATFSAFFKRLNVVIPLYAALKTAILLDS
jgi:hypothetical protein